MRLLLLTLGLTIVFSTPAYSEEQENLIIKLERRAGQGEAIAQTALGWMYGNGQGVPQDYAKAVAWYTKAAAQGYATAQYNLGVMYYDGQGVPQDYVQAHKWLNLAASKGQENAMKARDRLATRMTPDQIAEAQRLAREWKPKTSEP
jgi:TPR repeat protein